MIPFEHLLWIVPFCLAAGMLFSELAGKWNKKTGEINVTEKEDEEPEKERNQMELRAGMGVYRNNDPTFAEQFVNIMNYNGETQKEGDYEER